MKKCLKCKLDISGYLKECPLCQSKLEGNGNKSVFPNNIKRKKDDILFKILIFLSFVISSLTIFIEYYLFNDINWSLLIILGLITAVVSIYFVIINFGNIIKMISKYFILLLILSFIWFIATDNLIITTYIIPIICITMLAFNSIILSFLKDYYKNQYISTLFTDIIIGFIPLLLMIFGLTKSNIITHLCIVVDTIIILSLFIFCRRELLDEMKKRLSL